MWLLGLDWSVQGWECWRLVGRKLGQIQIGLWLMLVVITSADNIYSKMVQCQRSSIHRVYCFRNCAALIDASYHIKREAIPAQDQKKLYIFLNIYFIKEEYQKDKNWWIVSFSFYKIQERNDLVQKFRILLQERSKVLIINIKNWYCDQAPETMIYSKEKTYCYNSPSLYHNVYRWCSVCLTLM